MKKLYTVLPKQEYLSAMKGKFSSPFRFFGEERITGFVAGPFFSVAHHMPWEWNRRITSECNRAYGFVGTKNGETEVRYMCSRGLFSPFWLALFMLPSEVLFLVGDMAGVGSWILSAAISLGICGATAIDAGMTENGRAGAWEVYRFLQNPEKYE